MGENKYRGKMKNILMIMPQFYTYSEELKAELEKRGYVVDLFYEEPPRLLFLILRRLSDCLKSDFMYKCFSYFLYRKILRKRHRYSFFFVIRGNILTRAFVQKVKNNLLLPNARDVYYTWDSLTYLEHKGDLAKSFSYKYSFDSRDIANKKDWNLLPLFYTNSFDRDQIERNNEIKYDVTCIASLNAQRYKMLKEIVAANPNLRFNIRLYIDKKLYEYKKKTSEAFHQLDMSWVTFDLLSPIEVAIQNLQSRVVLDCTDSCQCGLSMRTVESIGLKKKLVTNNPYVKKYDFWNDGNVFYIDAANNCLNISTEWLQMEYNPNENVRKRYSLQHWLDVIMGLK